MHLSFVSTTPGRAGNPRGFDTESLPGGRGFDSNSGPPGILTTPSQESSILQNGALNDESMEKLSIEDIVVFFEENNLHEVAVVFKGEHIYISFIKRNKNVLLSMF